MHRQQQRVWRMQKLCHRQRKHSGLHRTSAGSGFRCTMMRVEITTGTQLPLTSELLGVEQGMG